jgi:hypothetical protein
VAHSSFSFSLAFAFAKKGLIVVAARRGSADAWGACRVALLSRERKATIVDDEGTKSSLWESGQGVGSENDEGSGCAANTAVNDWSARQSAAKQDDRQFRMP